MDFPRITGYDAKGSAVFLPGAYRLDWIGSLDTPADTLCVEFMTDGVIPSLSGVRMCLPDAAGWEGAVDEQETVLSARGLTVTLHARRKLAALLLDNEAIPASFDKPSLGELVRLHGEDCGLRGVLGDVRHPGCFTIEKGMSLWEVLDRFCMEVLGIHPILTQDCLLDARGACGGDPVLFSNDGGLAFRSAALVEKPCERISEILCKTQGQGGYMLSIKNQAAIAAGIRARRLFYDASYPEWQRRILPGQRLRDGERDAFCIRLDTALPVDCGVGRPAVFDGGRLGRRDDLVVSQVRRQWSRDTVSGEVVLQRREALLCGSQDN